MGDPFNVSSNNREQFWAQQKDQEKDAKRLDEKSAEVHQDVDTELVQQTATKQNEAQGSTKAEGQEAKENTQTTTQSNASAATQKALKSTLTKANETNTILQSTMTDLKAPVGEVNQPILAQPEDPTIPFPQVDVSKAFSKVVDATKNIPLPNSEPIINPEINVIDPAIIAYAQANGITPEEAQAKIMDNHAQLFAMAASLKLGGKDLQKLLYAYKHPKAAENLPKELQKLFEQLMQQTNQMTAENFQLPEGWTLKETDNGAGTPKMTVKFDHEFEKALKQFAKQNKLTDAETDLLRGMHYFPEGNYTDTAAALRDRGLDYRADDKAATKKNDGEPTEGKLHTLDELKDILKELNGEANGMVASEYGASPDTEIPPGTKYYESIATGKFREEFGNQLTAFKPPLSPEDIKLVLKAYENPDNKNIPVHIIAVMKKVSELTLAEVKQSLGLPDDWAPPLKLQSKKLDAAQFAQAMKEGKEGMKTLNQMLEKYEKHFKDVADKSALGPSIFNYYRAIGDAMNTLSEMIYSLMGSESEIASTLTTAQMDAKFNQINIRRAQIKEAMKVEPPKTGIGAIFGMIFTFGLILIVALVLAPFTGGMSLYFAVAYIIDSIQAKVTGEPSLFEQVFQAITEALGTEGGFLNFFLSILMSGGNPLLFAQLLFNESNALVDMLISCGVPKDVAGYINMAVQMLIMLVVMVALIIVSFFVGPQFLAAYMVQLTAFISSSLQTIGMSAVLAQIVVNIIMQLPTLIEIVVSALQAYNSVVTIISEVAQGKLAMIMARLEAAMIELQTLIAIFRKMISQILGSLQGQAEFLKSVQTFQGAKFNKASAITTQIATA